jgi:hypothetical protein
MAHKKKPHRNAAIVKNHYGSVTPKENELVSLFFGKKLDLLLAQQLFIYDRTVSFYINFDYQQQFCSEAIGNI